MFDSYYRLSSRAEHGVAGSVIKLVICWMLQSDCSCEIDSFINTATPVRVRVCFQLAGVTQLLLNPSRRELGLLLTACIYRRKNL